MSYVNYLSGLTATQSFEDKNSSFSYTSTMGVTVLDFDKVDLDKESFTLPRLPLQADETRKTHEVGASVE